MSVEDDTAVAVMLRTLDAWYLMSPTLTRNAITAWLESVNAPIVPPENLVFSDDVLTATYINDET